MKDWERLERRTAEVYDGRINPGSGNGWMRKNDVRTATESIECKHTLASQFALKFEDLRRAWNAANMDGRRMLFLIEFGKHKARYVVMNELDYLELKDRAENM